MGKVYRPPLTILSEGRAQCHYEPRGDYGLEGYSEDATYRFQRMEAKNGGYIRVYPGGADWPYFEVCGTKIFLKFFRILTEEPAAGRNTV